MSETRNIIFLGASYAGISATHYFLKHVYPHLPTSSTIKYQVILINASPKWYLRHASPRAIANTDLMPNEKIFIDIEPGFKQYGDKAKFLVGKATSWDPEKRVLSILEPSGREVSISYHALVLATGNKHRAAVPEAPPVALPVWGSGQLIQLRQVQNHILPCGLATAMVTKRLRQRWPTQMRR
jgi:NADH dehydrogenase FAD-containing subunit